MRAELVTRLKTITGLRVFDFNVPTIEPPTAIVSLPRITFDLTYGRGTDQLELPVILAIGKGDDRAAEVNAMPYVAGSGSKSVKGVLEGAAHTAFDTLQVRSAEFDVFQWNSIDYLCATFQLVINGSGA